MSDEFEDQRSDQLGAEGQADEQSDGADGAADESGAEGQAGDGATDGVGNEQGTITKDDATDAGAPMLPGSPGEPQGPEDALGEGLKRGDYADRIGSQQHAESAATADGGEPVYGGEDGDEVVDVKPRSELRSQNDRVSEVGDEAGEKGGVTTSS
jgi:hypothetical protein